ncbi:uncharacterized protein LOC18434212 isoform X1 [Amborella trichopoda]|uniref:uncharacterized protein LOC18434212 isoform X1 n=1 Tax=Amborella trichopoda TaxID=13333 RepID=UPI0009BD1C45|nr:uncharacterized protein LOC18434212 isoform X1 [Amborella trichopoda]|eukprot:XP_020522892.1 uncharacterized protein LOC18434212 isoform X1 [Amborella trichopoda]
MESFDLSAKIMVEKGTKPFMRDQTSSSVSSDGSVVHRTKSNSFFTLPGLFVGLNTKLPSDIDSIRSPTSPLEPRTFSGNPFWSPRSGPDGHGLQSHAKIWGDSKGVGLGIVDSLSLEKDPIKGVSDSKNILLGSQLRTAIPISSSQDHKQSKNTSLGSQSPKSLPNYVISPHKKIMSNYFNLRSSQLLQDSGSDQCLERGEPRSGFLDSGKPLPQSGMCHSGSEVNLSNPQLDSSFRELGSPKLGMGTKISFDCCNGFLSPSDFELSEDYTRVISHGPNPKTKHIFGDRVFECDTVELPDGKPEIWEAKLSTISSSYPSNEILSFCYACKKKLGNGKDIYIYRGEKAFCSCQCRNEQIMVDERMEKEPIAHSSPPSKPTSKA